MLRVGFDLSVCHFGQAGVARFSREIVAALRRQGVEVIEASFRPWFSRSSKWVRWVDTLRYERWWLHHEFPRDMEGRADVLQISIPDTVKTSLPQVVGLHDLNALKNPSHFSRHMGRSARRRIPRALARADAIITVSRYVKRDILETFPSVPADRVHVVPNAVGDTLQRPTEAEIRRVREKHALERPYVLCVSTIAPSKNFPRILEAFTRVAGQTDADLAVVGASGWRHAALDRLAAARQLGDRLKLLGFVPDADLPALYAGARTFCYPSLNEGFGIPVLEAMRCGTAVLTSNVTALPEVAGDAALLVDPCSVEEIASGLLRLLGDDALRTRLIQRGYVQEKKFSWDHSARILAGIYEQVVSQGRPG